MNFTVVLVGAGNMGGALLQGWIAGGMPAKNVTIIDPSPKPEMMDFLNSNSIRHETDVADIKAPDVLMLAVKPQMMDAVLPGLVPLAGDHTVAVSVAAGTLMEKISNSLGNVAVVRTIPNTPSLVGRGMTVACPSENVTETQRQHAERLLEVTGKLEWVDEESLIDAATAVSGSGPAYAFYLAECMAQAGEAAGLSPELAKTLARETVAGAGELLYHSTEEPSVLRKNVTSPGGTTAAALDVMMAPDALPKIVKEAILAARKRSQELS